MEEAMSQLIKLAPLAVALVIFAGVAAYLVQRDIALGQWLIAAFLLGHGLIHVMFATPPPTEPGSPAAEFAFDSNRSWLVTTRLVDVGVVRVLVMALVATTVAGYALAAMSTVGLGVSSDLWPALVVGATVASLGLMVIGLMPALALGIAVDVALLMIVFTAAWSPGRTALA
jgi:hypothetical protein